MRCAWCRSPLDDLHGHSACLNNTCPMYLLNQAECCSGETAHDGWVPTSDLLSPSCRTDEPPPGDLPETPPDEGPAGP